MSEVQTGIRKEISTPKMTNRVGLTKEEEIQIGLEMIPMFQAKEEELLIQKEKITNLKADIKSLGEE